MAISNRERVDRGLGELRNALKPVCERSWSDRYGPGWLTVVNDRLERPAADPSTDDPAFLLDGIIGTWDDVWARERRLGRAELDWLREVNKARSRLEHSQSFFLDDAERTLGVIGRLLVSFDAIEQRDRVEEFRDALLRQRYKKRFRPRVSPGKADDRARLSRAGGTGPASAGAPVEPPAAEMPNAERIELCQNELHRGLVIRCRRMWSKVYGAKEWRKVLNQKVSKVSHAPATDDLVFLLQGIIETWEDAWGEKHGYEVRRWVSEAYSGVVHSDGFSSVDEADWILGTFERILKAFGAGDQKAEVALHRDALLRRRYELADDERYLRKVEPDADPSDTEASAEGGSPASDSPTESATAVADAPEDAGTGDRPGAGRAGGPDGTEAEEEEESLGLLGAALLSAGFGADGSLPEEETEAAAAETPPSPEPTAASPAPEVEERAAPVPTPIEDEEPISPYDKRGSWYVINAYSGHEKKVKANLATLSASMHMQDRIFEVVIPTEKVVEIKGGRKVEVEKRMFPGYLLVRMYPDIDCLQAVRNTPGVTSFVGSGMGGGFTPTPLSRREVERFLGLKKEAAKKAPRFRPAWEIGETVRVSSGPFADFNGVVEDINVDQQKVTVLVEIFGRDTPMELDFEDIQKQ